jgi:PAS domain S-box-containing protein
VEAPSTVPAPDRALARALVEERWISFAGHIVLLSLVVVLTWAPTPHRALGVWTGAVFLLTLGRGAWSTYARRADLTPRAIVIVTRILLVGLGLAWSVGAAMIARYLPLAVFSIVVMALAGLLAGAINTLIADRWALPLYAVALFGPTLTARVLLRSGDAGIVEEILITLFVAFMILQHQRAHSALVQRLRLEEELRHRERQLSDAQTIAHVGSWEWDMITNVVTWSDELRRMYGLPANAPVGYQQFLSVAHPDDRTRLEALVAEGIRTRRTMEYEWRAVRPGGELRHIQGRNVVMTDDRGQAIRMAGISLDITDRKAAEENERTLLRELKASVTEVKVLRGILPICASCKRIRGEDGGWEAVESYVRDRTNAEFTHGLCPDCAKKTWV